MTKFMFTAINEDNVTTKEFDGEYLYDVIERFEEFLRGCGYFFYGHLDTVVEEDESNFDDEAYEIPIFESPDGGKTIYARQFGTSEKTLHTK